MAALRDILKEEPCDDAEALGNAHEQIAWLESQIDDPPKVAVLGAFKAGKSSVINTLMGERVAAVDPRPATCRPVEFLRGAEYCIHYLRDKVWHPLPPMAFFDLTDQTKTRPENDAFAATIERIRVEHPKAVLKNIVLVDTPGFGSGFGDHDGRAAQALDEAAAIVWVLDIDRGTLHADELKWIREVGEKGCPCWLLINKADLKPPSGRDEVAGNLRYQHGTHFERVFLFSSEPDACSTGGSEPVVTAIELESMLTGVRERARELQARQLEGELDAVVNRLLAQAQKEVAERQALRDELNAAVRELETQAFEGADHIGRTICGDFERDVKRMFRSSAPLMRRCISGEDGFWSDDRELNGNALAELANRLLQQSDPIADSVRDTFVEGLDRFRHVLSRRLDEIPTSDVEGVSAALAGPLKDVFDHVTLLPSLLARGVDSFLDGAVFALASSLQYMNMDLLEALSEKPSSAAEFLDDLVEDEEVLARLRFFCFGDREARQLGQYALSAEDSPLVLGAFFSPVAVLAEAALAVDSAVAVQGETSARLAALRRQGAL